MSDAAVMAAKAARILEDLGPFLADLEQDAFEAALNAERTNDEGRAKADDALRTVIVIRDLRSKLEVALAQGAQAAKAEQGGRRVA